MPEIITGIVMGATSIGCLIYTQRLRAQLQSEKEKYSEVLAKALSSERSTAKALAELDYLQKTIVQLMNRPVVATMTDQQVNNMIGALLQYADAAKSPEKMN